MVKPPRTRNRHSQSEQTKPKWIKPEKKEQPKVAEKTKAALKKGPSLSPAFVSTAQGETNNGTSKTKENKKNTHNKEPETLDEQDEEKLTLPKKINRPPRMSEEECASLM